MRFLTPSTLRAALIGTLLTGPVAADPFTVGVGAGVFPQFQGSDDYSIRALPTIRGSIAGFSFRNNGPGIEVDVLKTRAVDAGPILRYDFGRDPANIDNAQVSALPKIDPTVNVGGYAQVNIPISSDFRTFLSPRIGVVKGIGGGNDGLVVTPSVGVVHRGDKWIFGANISTTFADDTHMDTLFSVAPGSPSGLGAFTAGQGFKDVGASVFANYKINDTWSATAIGGYKMLLNDAADSPIVSTAGNPNQFFVGLGLSYTFN